MAQSYLVEIGLNYRTAADDPASEVRAEPGDTISDLTKDAIKSLLAIQAISPVVGTPAIEVVTPMAETTEIPMTTTHEEGGE